MSLRKNQKVIAITPVLTSFATPYSSGDVLGAILTVSAVVQDPKGVATLSTVVVLDQTNQKSALDLVFFDDLPASSIGADNAAYGLADADLAKCLGRVSVVTGDYASSGSANAEATLRNLGLMMQAKAGKKDIYVAIIARGTPTYGSASDLSIKLGFDQA